MNLALGFAYLVISLLAFMSTEIVVRIRSKCKNEDASTTPSDWGARVYEMSNQHPTLVVLLEVIPQTAVQLVFYPVIPDAVIMFATCYYALYFVNVAVSLKSHAYPY